jgi:hypothetical protein
MAKKLLSNVLTIDASKVKWSGKHGVMDMHALPKRIDECRLYDDQHELTHTSGIGFLVKGKNETRLFAFDRTEEKHHESFPSMTLYIFRSIWGNTITIRG